MNKDIEKLKDHILLYNTYFDTGWGVTYADTEASKIFAIRPNGNEPEVVFPNDTIGNFFYLRIDGQTNMVNQSQDIISDSQFGGSLSVPLWLIAGVRDADEDQLLQNLINTLRGYSTPGLAFNRAIFRSIDVIQNEMSAVKSENIEAVMQNLPDNLTLVGLRFTLNIAVEYSDLKNCIKNPCKAC